MTRTMKQIFGPDELDSYNNEINSKSNISAYVQSRPDKRIKFNLDYTVFGSTDNWYKIFFLQ